MWLCNSFSHVTIIKYYYYYYYSIWQRFSTSTPLRVFFLSRCFPTATSTTPNILGATCISDALFQHEHLYSSNYQIIIGRVFFWGIFKISRTKLVGNKPFLEIMFKPKKYTRFKLLHFLCVLHFFMENQLSLYLKTQTDVTYDCWAGLQESHLFRNII